jgi:hypothetical protein
MNDLSHYESMPTEELRDRAMDDLVKHYSLERISLEEFERRSDRISKAGSRGELLAQLADLPPIEAERQPRGSPRGAAATGRYPLYSGARENDFSVAIFGGSDFRGVWRAPKRLSALCLFGGTNIDLRKALIPEEGMSISCACAFGGIDIVVPPGMRLMVRGMGIFGGFDRPRCCEEGNPDAPTVVVEGIALFGGVSVKVRA